MTATAGISAVQPLERLHVKCDDDSSFDHYDPDQSLESTDDDIHSQEPSGDDRTLRKSSGETTPTFNRIKLVSPPIPSRQSSSSKTQPSHLAEIAAQPIENIVLRSSETPIARAQRIDAEREAKIKREADERRKSQQFLLNQASKGLRSSGGSTNSTSQQNGDVADKSADELLDTVPQDNFKMQKSAVERFEAERAQQAAAAAEKKQLEDEQRIAELAARQQVARQQKEAERTAKKLMEDAAALEAEIERLRKTEERRLSLVADMERRRWDALSEDEKERELRMKEREAQRQEAIRLEKLKKAEEIERAEQEERQRVEQIEAEKRQQEKQELEAIELKRQQEADAKAEAEAVAQRKIEEEKALILLQQQQQQQNESATTSSYQQQPNSSIGQSVELINTGTVQTVALASPAASSVAPSPPVQSKAETACCIVM